MARTLIDGVDQILAGSIIRGSINTATTGSALITKAIAGNNIGFSSTGVDAGTGDVTIGTVTTPTFVSVGFTSTVASKITLYGSAYGIGISSSELTLWTSGTLALRSGSYGGSVIFSTDSTGINSTPIGATTASTGAFSTLSASSTVSGTGFSNYLAAPPTIGGTTPGLGYFTNIPQGTDVGRNLLHNGQFRVQQRGAGAWTTLGAYTADRWQLGVNIDTASAAIGALTDTDRTALSDQSATSDLQITVTGSATAAAYSQIFQWMEDLRRYNGRTLTVSFWARCSVSNSLGVRLALSYGTGGSPSANSNVTAQTVSLTSTWAHYSLTFTVPSGTGFTFGTNLNSALAVAFGLSAASTNTAAFGVGVQSGNFGLWGVQCEFGSTATPLEKLDIATDYANCYRFYQFGQAVFYGYGAATAAIGYSFYIPRMRVSPTITITSNANSNISGFSSSALANSTLFFNGTATATGNANINVVYTASADF